MKKQFEQYKKLYITTIDFLMLLLPALFFWILWSREINELLYVDFKNKGNWLIVIFYVIVLAIMLHTFRGFKIGYYKIASLLISQLLALICTHIIIIVQLILMVGKVGAIGIIIANMIGLFLINWIAISCVTIVFAKIYNKLMPPYRLLHVYGDYQNNLKNKIGTRSDKYTIERDIYIGKPIDEIKKEILLYDGVVLNDIPSEKKNELLKFCFNNGIRVYFIPKISDIFIKGAEELNIFDTPLFVCKNTGLSIEQRIIKRLMDLIISSIVLVLMSPIMGVTALAIKLEDGGPVIYSQERCTINGKYFMLYKFRSMRVNAEKKGGAQLAKKNDDRITKTGNFIRKTRLDELPQLINVLKGDMSFVGPRPERPEFVEINSREIPEFRYRMKAKAGLTGYAQVFGKYNTSFLDKLKLDLLYIEKYTLLLDIQIILMTLKVILMKESAEGLDE
ncbi:sugar transferase [Diplocloster modestus]|uniref:Sugar transferase n=1 Tax=Diplocloster modestus TaxID=2850322 RepID=A0ABS6K217_9FIRM|nr:sugar transferase [Diplocloster modestus]MBU9724597.1 sugar transferase [Diplocloster modestus]